MTAPFDITTAGPPLLPGGTAGGREPAGTVGFTSPAETVVITSTAPAFAEYPVLLIDKEALTLAFPTTETRTPFKSNELMDAAGKVIPVVGDTNGVAVGVPNPIVTAPPLLFTFEIPTFPLPPVTKAPLPLLTRIPAEIDG